MRLPTMLLAVVLLCGCVTTPIRRSAFVPRNAIHANHGAPIGDGGMKAFGQVNSFELDFSTGGPLDIQDLLGRIPSEGAAGVWIPKVQFGAAVYGSPNEHLEIGAQAQYTNLKWAEENLIGVLPFPPGADDQQIIMGGPGVRANIPIEGTVITPSISFEANIATIPQAVYVRTGQTTVDPDGNIDVPEYEFERIDRKTFILPTLAGQITVSPMQYLHVLGMVGLTRNVKNIGFDPDIENLENDTLTGYFHGFFGAGVEGRYDWAFGTLVVHSAFAQPQEIRFGLSVTASVGVLVR